MLNEMESAHTWRDSMCNRGGGISSSDVDDGIGGFIQHTLPLCIHGWIVGFTLKR
jgi:hypothetical protein